MRDKHTAAVAVAMVASAEVSPSTGSTSDCLREKDPQAVTIFLAAFLSREPPPPPIPRTLYLFSFSLQIYLLFLLLLLLQILFPSPLPTKKKRRRQKLWNLFYCSCSCSSCWCFISSPISTCLFIYPQNQVVQDFPNLLFLYLLTIFQSPLCSIHHHTFY